MASHAARVGVLALAFLATFWLGVLFGDQRGAARALSMLELVGLEGDDEPVATGRPGDAVGADDAGMSHFMADAALGSVELDDQPLRFKGVLHFLFMVGSGFGHLEVWREFFSETPPGYATIWVHCSTPECDMKEVQDAIPRARFVQQTPSKRCLDLVTPQAKLVRVALKYTRSARAYLKQHGLPEKFLFVSGSDLPVKPFSEIYRTLLENNDSDFCLQSTPRWQSTIVENQNLSLVKHNQWVVLNRPNAETFAKEWVNPGRHSGRWSFLLRGRKFRNKNTYVFVEYLEGSRCADEFAVFATIFGILGEDPDVGLGYCPLSQKLPTCDKFEELQKLSRCRTLQVFNKSSATMAFLLANDSGASSFQRRSSGHPVEWETMSTQVLQKLRKTKFLFVRKVLGKGVVLSDFCRVILDRQCDLEPPEPADDAERG